MSRVDRSPGHAVVLRDVSTAATRGLLGRPVCGVYGDRLRLGVVIHPGQHLRQAVVVGRRSDRVVVHEGDGTAVIHVVDANVQLACGRVGVYALHDDRGIIARERRRRTEVGRHRRRCT